MIEIEKGLQIPDSKMGAYNKYPFAEMSVGDSLLDLGVVTTPGSKIYHAAMSYAQKHGWKFTGRAVDGGVRIWRTE